MCKKIVKVNSDSTSLQVKKSESSQLQKKIQPKAKTNIPVKNIKQPNSKILQDNQSINSLLEEEIPAQENISTELIIKINEIIQNIYQIIPKNTESNKIFDDFKRETEYILNKKSSNNQDLNVLYTSLKKLQDNLLKIFGKIGLNPENATPNIQTLEKLNFIEKQVELLKTNNITTNSNVNIDKILQKIDEQDKCIENLKSQYSSLQSQNEKLQKELSEMSGMFLILKSEMKNFNPVPIQNMINRIQILENNMQSISKLGTIINEEYLSELRKQIEKIFTILKKIQNIQTEEQHEE